MKIRIVDIAKKAGVSPGTVDRIIHQRGRVSDKANEKVKKAIDELGYAPDILARNLALKKELQIVCLVPNPKDAKYWERPVSGIEKAIESLASFKVNIHKVLFSTQADELKKACDKVLALNPDGVVYVPMFFEESKYFTDKLNISNTPFVQLNIHHPQVNPISYIGQDPIAAGHVAATLCNLALKADNRILVAYVSKEQQEYAHLNPRIEGFLNFFKEQNHASDNIDHLQLKIGDDKTKHETTLSDFLKKSPNTQIIYVPNSRVHKIAELLKNKQIQGVMLVGFDTLEENIKYLKEGYIKFLIGQQSKSQGYNAVTFLFDALFRKEAIKKEHYLPIDILNQENINFYEGLLE